ncbi:Glycerate dehydrogenase [Pseudobythopirellula maris]|uniref:Glycerate dehydrogenase n=1 Tax=Pseudobythopirellula maris TaxID=2527991 RepID=A0A5C5ZIE0_9BACT|nr:D-2-hydroxyacid dehydrogenase [Pseudobythopirellula maris]TWT86885.1 Glycerate dehydrogenase [Pseudobythopirellula maris]
MKIVLCYPVEDRHVAQIRTTLQQAGVQAEVVDAGQERIAEQLLDADIYCGHAKVPVPWPEVVAAGKLKWIQSSAAGMDHCLVPEVIASSIPVSSASGILADQVADHTMALLCGSMRSLPVFFRAQQKKEFIRRPTRDLHGSRVGIVGFGGNGRRLAEVLSPFKTRLFATDCFPEDKPEYVEELLGAEELDSLLPRVDVLILAAPLNDETRGMIDGRRLNLMPRGSFLVNMARGPLVVEEDLADALESGQLAGAGIDVTEVEPLAPESRLWEQPNLIITPHVGGQKSSRLDDMTDFFCLNLDRWFRGETPRNLVEKKLGFPLPEHANWKKAP